MPASKRDRKHKNTGFLKQKASAGARQDVGLDLLLSEELRAHLEGAPGLNEVLVLPSNGKGCASGRVEEEEEAEPVLSKSERRKLKQVQAKKERREGLAHTLSELDSHKLVDQHLALLRPLHQRGHRQTKKQALKQALKMERAGLSLPAGEEDPGDVGERMEDGAAVVAHGKKSGTWAARQLLQPRQVLEGNDSDSEDGGSYSENKAASMLARAAAAGSAAHPAACKATAVNGHVGTIGSKGVAAVQEEDGAGPRAGTQYAVAEDVGCRGISKDEETVPNSAPPVAKRRRSAADVTGQDTALGRTTGAAAVTAATGQAAGPVPVLQQLDLKNSDVPAAVPMPPEEVVRQVKAARAELGLPAGEDNKDDAETTAARRQAAAAAVAAAAFPHRVATVMRSAAIEAAREGLPIVGMEADVMEAVTAHDVIVLCGETGCGKTTQVPQFLLEAGYGCRAFPERAGAVGITQPRRVAAVSTATRVAEELGGPLGQTVGYQVRYDRAVGKSTALKFMTDGILLREVQQDFLLRRYSAIIVDEAHERSLATDLLLGMLSRAVPLRRKLWQQQQERPCQSEEEAVYPLKLIIMSATLRTEDFTANAKLFPTPPPVIQVPARQYPVTVHFARRTELRDYVGAAFRKVLRIHCELPPGGVLVFLTGQLEVERLCAKLRGHYAAKARRRAGGPAPRDGSHSLDPVAAATSQGAHGGGLSVGAGKSSAVSTACCVSREEVEEAEEEQYGGDAAEAVEGWRTGEGRDEHEPDDDDYEELNRSDEEDEEEVQVLGGDAMTPEEVAAAEARFEASLLSKDVTIGSSSGAMHSVGGVGGMGSAGLADEGGPGPLHVLPLYAMLAQAAQGRVFEPTPAGHRLIVVATNVAETSLTIPGIRYVVDAGRSKQKLLEDGGLSRFEVRWVSQASALQRAGRAGRTGPGHCYRLYSSALFNDTFARHTPPEILSTPLEGVLLSMKSMGVDKALNFPFPTAPDAAALREAQSCLVALSALHPSTFALTAMGKAMAAFPISPRHSRMLLEVLRWQQEQQRQAAPEASQVANSGGVSVPVPSNISARAHAALPYALALAAALSVESPFIHLDSLGAADGVNDPDAATILDKVASKEVDAAALAARQKTKQRASAAHARFRSTVSDALSALAVLCAYEAEEESDAFCRSNFLHARNLREMADLHRQLARALTRQQQRHQSPTASMVSDGSDLAKQLSSSALQHGKSLLEAVHASPTAAVQDCLRRAMTAGWADQVSRRIRSAEHLQQSASNGHSTKRHAVRYQPCSIDQEVFLHPRSALHATAPELVVYTSVLRTVKRPYMSGVTAVEASWLAEGGSPLCKLSEPLLEPPSYYSSPADAVLAWHKASYSRLDWPLPNQARRHPVQEERSAVFAAALLEGRVLPAFSGLRSFLAAAPAMAAAPEMRGVARVGELVGALARRRVDSRSSLATAWAADKTFLQAELAGWVLKNHHSQLALLWPQLLLEAASSASIMVTKAREGGGQKRRRKD